MNFACCLLPYEIAQGPANMALDEALLERVGACPDTVFLRTYGWLEPTLSLGYFQHQSQVLAEPRWQSVPMVRRSTGGGAIWHDRELTYAVILPANFPGARPAQELYRKVHSAIAELLRERGLDACRRADASNAPPPGASNVQRRPVLCFRDTDPEDIIASGFKVVGSAQRRRGRAILQHGSILLASSDRTPELKGISDLAAVASAAPQWSETVALRIAKTLGLTASLGDWSADIRQRALDLACTLYGNASWTAKR
ncbi:MAG: hypothetical protein JO161_01500 [Planctomycetaceae bacterium]|nr:hypothetical protein [Planctomycetaceae bacterium]